MVKEVTKIVLTGGPCCGKTTLIEALAKKGHSVMDEVARELIAQGITPKLPSFQEAIYDLQLERESVLNGLVFLDRGVCDCFAYANFYGNQINRSDTQRDYSKVFLLDRFPFEADGERVESGEGEAERIHNLIETAYLEGGYDLVRVPVLPVGERVDFILRECEKYV